MPVTHNQTLLLTIERNALDYLERACGFLKHAPTDAMAWKWVVIGLHGALYGFAVAACKGTDPNNVMDTTPSGKRVLISFDEALKRCQNPKRMHMLIHSQHLQLTHQLTYQQRRSIRMVKKVLRNRFEHYEPSVWAIETNGVPQIAGDALEVIRFLALETNTYVNLSSAQHRRIDRLIEQSQTFLRRAFRRREKNKRAHLPLSPC